MIPSGHLAAYQVAKEAHKEQRRRSGEPYISHPVAVAMILVGLGMDTETAWWPPCCTTWWRIPPVSSGESIGAAVSAKDVALLVEGVTKLGQVPFSSREEQQAENVRKMLLAMAQDVRVIIIKLADRLSQYAHPGSYARPRSSGTKPWRPWRSMPPWLTGWESRAVKEELEDTALRFLDPGCL